MNDLKTIESMTSKEIAALTGKEHFHVTRDIKGFLENPNLDFVCKSSTYMVKGQTNKYNQYELPKRETLILVSGYSVELRTVIIDRWQALEVENALLRNQENQRVIDRQKARMDCPLLTSTLKETRADIGKRTKGFHYSNEFDMINRIVVGMTAKKFREENGICVNDAIRDSLTPLEIKGIKTLQILNTSLIDVGIDFKERKKMLKKKWDRLKIRQTLGESLINISIDFKKK